MAHSIGCDICNDENAVQMLTSLDTGETIAMGPACLPLFYAQSVLTVMGAGEHKGLPQKCQACRRVHERVTMAARPAAVPADDLPANVRNGPGPAGDVDDDDSPDAYPNAAATPAADAGTRRGHGRAAGQ